MQQHDRAAAWRVYDPVEEFARMGALNAQDSSARTSAWRITNINQTYDYCPTYPATLVVPSKISDTTLNYGKSYRSKSRIPCLVYLHWSNLGSITRSSQPMVGIKNNRSIQDEKLIEAIFTSHSQHHSTVQSNMASASYIAHSQTVYGATSSNLIIDARPTTNAMANVAKGAGTENMEYYRNCKKLYLGIDNIHVMRDSLAKIVEATRSGQENEGELLRRSGWLKHLAAILEGVLAVVKAVHLANSHVLVHCSDGWDRTSQLSSLSQVCLDPFYRTKNGLAVLIEKDWVSFGHRFSDRCGHLVPARVQMVNTLRDLEENVEEEQGLFAAFQQRLNFSSSSHLRETCPVFDQYLDAIHQLQLQFPQRFEFNDQFLLDLQRYAYECAHGTFLHNSERERKLSNTEMKTRSVWEDLLDSANNARYRNEAYVAEDREVLFPDPGHVKWWTTWFKQPHMESYGQPELTTAVTTVVTETADDPALAPVIVKGEDFSGLLRQGDFDTDTLIEAGELRPASPATGVPRQLATVFDSNTVASASTAVHGAVKSAWSAWKSVRSVYDGSSHSKESQDQVLHKQPLNEWRAEVQHNGQISVQQLEHSNNTKPVNSAGDEPRSHSTRRVDGCSPVVHDNVPLTAEGPGRSVNAERSGAKLSSPKYEASNLDTQSDPLGVGTF